MLMFCVLRAAESTKRKSANYARQAHNPFELRELMAMEKIEEIGEIEVKILFFLLLFNVSLGLE